MLFVLVFRQSLRRELRVSLSSDEALVKGSDEVIAIVIGQKSPWVLQGALPLSRLASYALTIGVPQSRNVRGRR